MLIGVAGDREVGARIASHPDIGKVMFTGSTATGRSIVESSAQNLARLTLELGGNDAGIVLPGVDATARSRRISSGARSSTPDKTCAALKRLYVHDSVYDEVVDALADVARQTPMGNGLDEQNVLGPLQNRAQFEIVRDLVDDAARNGGRIVTGGAPATELGELFYPITLVADVTDGVALVDEEQFGPALPIIRYTPMWTRRSPAPTASMSASGRRSGASARRRGRSPRASRPAPSGSIRMAVCIR